MPFRRTASQPGRYPSEVKKLPFIAVVFMILSGLAPGSAGASVVSRVVILGFDGADPKLTEQYLAEGKLPNLARLKAEGSYDRLATTNPPQTPYPGPPSPPASTPAGRRYSTS